MRNIFVCAVTFACAFAAASDSLRIFLFDVGQAESSLIVFPSGFSILVDCPELVWSSSSTVDALAPKIEAILGKKEIDVAIVTHLHLDHIGYFGRGGMWKLIEGHGFKVKKFIDRNAGSWTDLDGDAQCDSNEINWNNAGSTSSLMEKWICYTTSPTSTNINPVRELAVIGSTTQIDPPDVGAVVKIVAADAAGAVMADGSTPVSGNQVLSSCPPNENDYSIGFLLSYRGFRYAAFGDLDGEWTSAAGGGCYNDIESTVIPRLWEVDALKVNHHGSQHSSSDEFINALHPRVSLISVGANNLYGHPTQVVLDKLNPIGSVFITEDGNPLASYGTAKIANGDIVVTVSNDGRSYTVTPGTLASVPFVTKANWTADSTDTSTAGAESLPSGHAFLLFLAASVALSLFL